MLRFCLLFTLFAASAAFGQTTDGPADGPAAEGPVWPKPMRLDRFIQPGDRVLFVGDELTQQMFYTRAVASALLAGMHDAGLRFFNGGKEGATAASMLGEIDDLLDLCRPTVVFMCFGLNDGKHRDVSETVTAIFERNLTALVKRVGSYRGVRQVVILGPPPVPGGLEENVIPTNYNWTLYDLSLVCHRVAKERGVGFIELYSHMKGVYLTAERAGGDPLSLDGRLPTEAGHTLLASIILYGIGVTPKHLDSIGWSPLPPTQMRRVRGALALKLKSVDLEAAHRSHRLYVAMQPFDEAFFRLWRLTDKRSSGPTPELYRSQMQQAWADVEAMAKEHYGSVGAGK